MAASILITRQELQAREFSGLLIQEGYEVFLEPLLEQQELDFEIPSLENIQAFIFTSATAVKIWCSEVRNFEIPVYTVGSQTEKAARESGFKNVMSAAGNAESLIQLVAQKAHPEESVLLHIRGAHQTGNISVELSATGFDSKDIIIYEMKKAKMLSPELREKLAGGDIDLVTFFSMRTAENFISLINQYGLEKTLHRIKALCISDAVLECVQDLPWQGTYSAETPDRDGMLHLIRKLAGT